MTFIQKRTDSIAHVRNIIPGSKNSHTQVGYFLFIISTSRISCSHCSSYRQIKINFNSNFQPMKTYGKIFLASTALAIIAYTTFVLASQEAWTEWNWTPVEIARQRAEEAQKELEKAIDNQHEATWNRCYSDSIKNSSWRFIEKQRRAYECFKNEVANTNSWTVASASSEAPKRLILNNSDHVKKSWTWWKIQGNQSSVSIPEHWGSKKGLEVWIWKTQKTDSGTRWYWVKPDSGKLISWVSKEASFWRAYEEAVKLIQKFEWYAPVAKMDVKQCSGWFGHKAPCGMKVSKAQADKWLAEDAKKWISQVIADFPHLKPQAQWALASFMHNCPAWYRAVKTRWLKSFYSWCNVAYDSSGKVVQKYTAGLKKRRAEEALLIFSK